LSALTVRCFDLIDPCRTTSCLALSRLNDEGIISGCEGDVPSLWTMMVVFAATKHASFMANPSSSNPSENVVDFAHCTIPAKMTTSFTLPTHFESGMSVAIAGKLPVGDYRIVKIGGRNLDKMFTAKGKITHNTHIAARCRTQIRFQFADFEQYRNFADNRLGNHIIILPE
ncbi:MAG: fucose isomerase, partial [Bacteroidales bacterium]|nr:fucose isomerase [Bacteroidales bacterium]